MYDFAVIFFSDIQGFTAFAAINSSLEVFAMLERVFTVMDYCVGLFPSLYKVETAGDSYMVVGGLDGFDDDNVEDEEDAGNLGLAEGGGVGASESAMHSTERQSRLSALKSSPSFQSLVHASQGNARDTKNVIVANAVCQFALLVRDAVQKVNMDESSFVQIRIGIHCGSITTGISGKLTPKFCIFGDTVNCAARMEQTGRTGKVHISAGMRSFILHSSLSREYYDYEKREPIEVKGKGTLQTYCECHVFRLICPSLGLVHLILTLTLTPPSTQSWSAPS
jgi:class 3 adenylate cyclase